MFSDCKNFTAKQHTATEYNRRESYFTLLQAVPTRRNGECQSERYHKRGLLKVKTHWAGWRL